MGIRLEKPWQPLTAGGLRSVKGQLGVYQLGDGSGQVQMIGVADARSLFGLRGCLEAHLQAGDAAQYRLEVTTAYSTRYRELLMLHMADHGTHPPMNDAESLPRLGRLSPA